MVAMLRPKHREMRTRSAGGTFSSPAFQLMVEPRLRRTKMNVARYSPDTALQKSLVQMPLKATMMLWQLQQCRNLLARRDNQVHDPFRVSGCTKHSLQNRSKWASFRAHLSGLVKITVTAQLKGFECTVQCLLVSLAETHQKREHALPLWAPDESDVFSLMNPGELFTQRRQLSLHDSLKIGKVEWGTYKRAAGGGRARVEQRAGLSEGHQPHIVELDRVQQLY